MNKNRALLFVIIIAALSIIIPMLYLNSNPIPETKPIIDSADIAINLYRESWGNPVGMTMDYWFKVTISNRGTNALEGLTMNLIVINSSNQSYGWGMQPPEIGRIQSNKTSEVQLYILTGLTKSFDEVAGHNATVQLILKDKILDESSFALPTRAFG